MNWRLGLSIFFISSVTGSWVPENHDLQSSDDQSNQTSRSYENSSESNNSSKTADMVEHKDLFNLPKNNDCFSSIDMKRTIIVILESVRRNPEVLDKLIGKLNSEVEQESHTLAMDNNTESNYRRSFLMHLQLPEQSNANQLATSYQCARSITELAETIHKAYLNFKSSPICMKFLHPENKNYNSDLHAKDTLPDINMMINLLLKEMGRYNDLNNNIQQNPDKNHVMIPEPYSQDWNIVKPTIPEDLSKTDNFVYQPNPNLGPPFENVPFITENNPSSAFITQPHIQQHSPFTPLTLSNYEMPSFAMQYDVGNSNSVIPQGLNNQAPFFSATKPQGHIPQILQPITTELPVFNNNNPIHNIYTTYPKIIDQPHEPVFDAPEIMLQNNYDKLKHYGNVPAPVVNKTPIHLENQPIRNVGHSVYTESHSLYSSAPQPFHTDTTPISPKTNIVKLILKLLSNKPSEYQINSIRKTIEHNHEFFEPNLYKILFALLDSYGKGLIDNNKIYKIYQFLLQPQVKYWWNEEKRDLVWRLLQTDEIGQINLTNIDLIVSLIHSMNRGSSDRPEQFMPQSMIKEEDIRDPKKLGVMFTLLSQNREKTLRPDQEQILLSLLQLSENYKDKSKYINIANALANWDKIPYLNSEYINIIFSLLKPNSLGIINTRAVDIINEIILQKARNILRTDEIDKILSFLKPDEIGNVKSKRLEIVLLILNSMSQAPQIRNAFIQLLDGNLTKSKYVDVLLALYKQRILSIQLLEALITLIKQEKSGYIDDYIINKVILLLVPHKNQHPQIITDILRELRTTGYSNLQSATDFNTNALSIPDNMKIWLYDSPITNTHQQLTDSKLTGILPPRNHNDLRGNHPDIEKVTLNYNLLFSLLHMPQNDLSSYTKSLDRNGFIELTYLINKIPVYRPVYYVKYKIPMIKLLTILNTQNAQSSIDPMILLRKLIIEGNMSEVSPTLKGLTKEDILQLTFKEGDLVQAKLLDEPIERSSLNEQIKMVHNLNADVTPEEIIEQNKMNSAKFFTNIRENVGGQPNLNNLNIVRRDSNHEVVPKMYR